MRRYWDEPYMEYDNFFENDPYSEYLRGPYPGTALRIGARGNNVMQLQKNLNAIARGPAPLPVIAEDGIFGPGTRSAVIAFQSLYGLVPDGVVGPVTWNKINDVYNAPTITNNNNTYYPGFLLGVGSLGRNVATIQHLINLVAAKNPDIPRVAEDGIFGHGTQNAVKLIQRQFGLSVDGIIGPSTWNRILGLANAGAGNAGGGTGGKTGGGTGGNTGGSTGGSTSGMTEDEVEVFNLVNDLRRRNGLSPLTVDAKVQAAAHKKAQEMADKNYFSHTSPTYGSPFDMLKTYGVSFKSAAENIAGNSTNKAAVISWENSAGHRTNMLNGSYQYTGIGVAKDPRYGKVYAQMFIGK